MIVEKFSLVSFKNLGGRGHLVLLLHLVFYKLNGMKEVIGDIESEWRSGSMVNLILLVVEKLMMQTEKISDVQNCSDDQKISFATLYLK